MKQDWEIKRLGEVCIVIAGQSPEGKYYNSEAKGLPFYQGKKEFGDKFIGEPKVWTSKITKEAKESDILMSVRAPVGPINYSTQNICIGRGLAAIRATKLIDKEYLFNFLLKHENEIVGNTGAVFNSINKAQIEAIKIPLPPLEEQQQIVSILDETFQAIDQAKANAEQNLQNSKELFESSLQNIFSNGDKGWEEKKLKDIGKAQTGTTPKTAEKDNYGNFIPFIKPADVDFKSDGSIRYDNVGLTEKGLKSTRLMPKNSILMVCIGATIGKVGFVDRDVTSNQQINSFTVSKDFYPKFFYYALRSKNFYDSVIKSSAQATLPIINKGKWETLSLKFPKSLTEQQAIAKKLDILQVETKKLEAIYIKKIADLEELKKSILHKAFARELKLK
ncbi:restriction endonuclease subunit S [Flavobacterium sp. 83]|uniref:restriction endonuclease subunit S n=1 Tax=Flavobacterium sp. 83 TaxID=1131812 RepID=UPI0005503763|nr:restriction endonuclease subunit S [Flavobacterium sp. 83]